MKRTITKLVLLLLAVLTTGSVNATVTDVVLEYDYAKIATDNLVYNSMSSAASRGNGTSINNVTVCPFTISYSDKVILTSDDVLMGNGAAVIRYADVNYIGFWCRTYATNFGIKGLQANDKIEVAILGENTPDNLYNLTKNNDTSTFTHTWTYNDDEKSLNYTVYTLNVTAAGDVLFQLPSGTYVGKIKVTRERETTAVPVTIGIIPDASVEEYDLTATGLSNNTLTTGGTTSKGKVNNTDINVLQLGSTTYDRFAVSRVGNDGGWKIKNYGNATEKGLSSQYGNRYFTILNLKDGDKITINWATAGTGSLNFYDVPATSVDVSAGAAVASGTVYTISTEEESVNVNLYTVAATEDTNGENAKVCIYSITIDPAAAHVGNYIGATLVSQYALNFTDVEGITAYVATAANAGSVTFSKVTKVAAETPLYIKANEESGSVINVNVPELEGDAETIPTNLLKGSASQTTSLTSDADTKYYYVFGVQDNTAGFYRVPTSPSSFTSAAGKAYLELTAAQAVATSRISMIFDEGSETTGINMIQSSEVKAQESDAYYNLAGQRVVKPTRGLYIVNGKKVFIK